MEQEEEDNPENAGEGEESDEEVNYSKEEDNPGDAEEVDEEVNPPKDEDSHEDAREGCSETEEKGVPGLHEYLYPQANRW